MIQCHLSDSEASILELAPLGNQGPSREKVISGKGCRLGPQTCVSYTKLYGNREGVSVTPVLALGWPAPPKQPYLVSDAMCRVPSSPSTVPQIIYMIPSSSKGYREVSVGHIHRCHLQGKQHLRSTPRCQDHRHTDRGPLPWERWGAEENGMLHKTPRS